jgi:hypothetical protein
VSGTSYSYYTTEAIGNGGNPRFHCVESYTALTTKSNICWALERTSWTTNDSYGIRTFDGYYLVAIGTSWGIKPGEKFDAIMKDGKVIHCIMGDTKADKHTDPTNTYTMGNGSYLEFLVDWRNLDSKMKKMGQVSCYPEFEGELSTIVKSSDENPKFTYNARSKTWTVTYQGKTETVRAY